MTTLLRLLQRRQQGLANQNRLAQRFKDIFTVFESRQGFQAAQRPELTRCKNTHVAARKPLERFRVFRQELRCRIQPFLIVVA